MMINKLSVLVQMQFIESSASHQVECTSLGSFNCAIFDLKCLVCITDVMLLELWTRLRECTANGARK